MLKKEIFVVMVGMPGELHALTQSLIKVMGSKISFYDEGNFYLRSFPDDIAGLPVFIPDKEPSIYKLLKGKAWKIEQRRLGKANKSRR